MSLFGLEKPSLPGAQGHCTTDVTKRLRRSKKRIWKTAAYFACMAPSSLKKWGIDWPLLRVSLFIFEIVNASFFKGYFKDQKENNAIEWTNGWARKNFLLRLLYLPCFDFLAKDAHVSSRNWWSCSFRFLATTVTIAWRRPCTELRIRRRDPDNTIPVRQSLEIWAHNTGTRTVRLKKKSWCFRRVFLFIFFVLVFS